MAESVIKHSPKLYYFDESITCTSQSGAGDGWWAGRTDVSVPTDVIPFILSASNTVDSTAIPSTVSLVGLSPDGNNYIFRLSAQTKHGSGSDVVIVRYGYFK